MNLCIGGGSLRLAGNQGLWGGGSCLGERDHGRLHAGPPIRAWGEGPQEVGDLAPGWGLMELAGPREGLAEVGWMGKEATGGWLW